LLQEAGSIIWQDGSCVGYLRNEPPEIGEAMFVRPVDFCSAAFLMIRRSSWLSLGGFNETYSPAYYEEVDFCCRLIERGEYVVYLPNVVVDHYEFASTAGMARATQMQMDRRDIFTRLNEKFLTDQLPADGKNVVRARDRDPRPSVLIIDDQIPRESAGQGFPRIVRLVRLLTDRGYRVCIGATAHEGSVDWPDIWQELGTTVECIPDLSPRTLEAFLEERSGSYQVLWVSRPHNLRYLTEIEGRRPGLISAPLIYDAEALVASNALGNEGAAIDIAELQQAARPETDATHLASAIVSVSELDRGVFVENTQKPTFIASHSLEIKEGQSPFDDRRGVLFFGALSNVKSPNVNGLDWFIQEVWPLMPAVLQREHPLTVAGQVLPSLTKKWQAQGVEVLGLVADLSGLADGKRAFVAPTRRAQGIPIKALEAASYGLPMVMTAILAQQLNWRNEEQALVASNPQEFADALTRLLTEEALWKSLHKEAAASVAKICDPEKFNENVLAALNLFVEPPQGSN
jgi:glycosyltransferase involved in cell wall biosynthesis